MRIEYYGDTNIGRVREINEDAFLSLPDAHLAVVCDGMGGHAAGEVASREALQVLAAYFAGDPEQFADRLTFLSDSSFPPCARHLVRAVRLANRRVFTMAQERASSRGMGTTLAAMCFADGLVSLGHVGDSRAYRLRGGRLERLTIDHSLVAELVALNELTEEESRYYSERNVITRALGTRAGVDVDLRVETTAPKDVYLLCSDGLCGFVDDPVIERTLKDAGADIRKAARNLIEAANAAGGADNITIVLARVDTPGKAAGYGPREATTITDADGAPGDVADTVLQELAAAAPVPDQVRDEEDTQKVPKTDAPPAAEPTPDRNPSPGGQSWILWLALLAAVNVFVYLGGINLLLSAP